MTAIAEMVRLLLEKGAAPDVIKIAIEGAEQYGKELLSTGIPPEDRMAAKRRAWDRERKRGKAIPPEFHRNTVDAEPELLVPQVKNLTSFKKESDSDRPSLGREERTKSNSTGKRGTRLPADWMPADPDYATEILRDRAAIELEKFRNHWAAEAGAKAVKRDWEAAWRNWVLRASEFTPRNRNGKSQLMQAFDRLEERMGHEEATDFELRQGNLLSLPFGSVRRP